jgi:hypothetical protein
MEEGEGAEEDDEDVKGFKFLQDLGRVTYDSGPYYSMSPTNLHKKENENLP